MVLEVSVKSGIGAAPILAQYNHVYMHSLADDDFNALITFDGWDYLPEEDVHWDCFLVLWDICTMVCAHEVTKKNSAHLAWLVKTYLELFVELYGSENITPKMHHLVHLPEQINLLVTMHIHTYHTKTLRH